MKTIYHSSATRGHADHGWLNAHHTFSFASYYDPKRQHFGVLRVLNDDIVDKGMGFGMHPHDNMEIITIPISGELQHKDSMGNTEVIRENEVQIMSAGTGIRHSEFNPNKDRSTNLLQLWIFPKVSNITPRYDQKKFSPEDRKNAFKTVVSPNDSDALWINQDAWLSLASFEKGHTNTYTLKKQGNGVYIFLIAGSIKIGDQLLQQRDGLGVWDTDKVSIQAENDAEILLIDVPMEV